MLDILVDRGGTEISPPESWMGLIQSIYMKPKQSEMDGIIERIYNTFTTEQGERTLMVVCGDHGMNDVYSFYWEEV